MFQTQGCTFLKHIKNGLRAEFKCLKVICKSELVGRKNVSCFIAGQNFKKFD